MTAHVVSVDFSRGGCPSDMEMDRYFLDGAPKEHRITRHLERCVSCSRRWAAYQADCVEFDACVFPVSVGRVIDRVQQEQQNGLSQYFGKPFYAFAAAAASVLLGIALLFTGKFDADQRSFVPSPYIGEKGAIGMEVWCRRAEKVFRVHEGEKLYAEDMLRFVPRFSNGASRYAMVISRDAAGNVTQYAPQTDGAAAFVPSGEALPGSVVLDDVEGEEVLFLFAGNKPFRFEDLQSFISTATKGGEPTDAHHPLPPDLMRARLVVEKARMPIRK